MMMLKRVAQVGSLALLLAACGDGDDVPELPIGMMDAGRWDAGPLDARVPEAGRRDAGSD
jgi:hypothetical protein